MQRKNPFLDWESKNWPVTVTASAPVAFIRSFMASRTRAIYDLKNPWQIALPAHLKPDGHRAIRSWALLMALICLSTNLPAQENYEIQVYGSETVKPGMTMVELHSNFTFQGTKKTIDGMWPTN